MIEFLVTNRARLGRLSLLVAAVLALIVGAQAALFYSAFGPRMAQANAQLFDLIVEKSQRTLYRNVDRQIDTLEQLAPEGESGSRTLASAWQDFQTNFVVAPREAIDALASELPGLTATISDEFGDVTRLDVQLNRLRAIYADTYKDLLDDLKSPPAYLWPTAHVIAGRSGYRQAATLNRALYLAQTGEIGTARVMLAGLNAAVDDPELLGTIYYALGRLQFELFRDTPEADYFTQAVQYLRQSLEADPDAPLPKRLLDYLLSLEQTATAPQAAEGRPETPSEGEGAAISAERRVF